MDMALYKSYVLLLLLFINFHKDNNVYKKHIYSKENNFLKHRDSFGKEKRKKTNLFYIW